MGLQQVVWGVAVVIFVLCKGCHSQQPACGVATLNSRIVGGQTAAQGSWPWQAALNMYGNISCGGSLITKEWILTAAHCISLVDLNNTVVHLGLQNVSGFNPNEVTRRLADIVCHPLYNPRTFENDICLLKLAAPVNFTTYIQPICLAAANSTFYNGTSSWVTGYGNTDSFGNPASTLQEVSVPIIGNRQCQCFHPRGTVTRNMICAGHLGGGRDSCQGDSGGPLMSKNGPAFVQSGVVSWGAGCAQPQSPGVYTRVSSYYRWINDTVTGMRPSFVAFMSGGNNSDLYFTCPSPPPFSTPYPPFTDTYPPFPFNTTYYPPFPFNTTYYPPFPFNTTYYPPYPPYTTYYPPYPPYTTDNPFNTPRPCNPFVDNDLFCNAGENLIHFTSYVALSILAPVLHVFVGSG